jgi:HAT1-interacting factor 1
MYFYGRSLLSLAIQKNDVLGEEMVPETAPLEELKEFIEDEDVKEPVAENEAEVEEAEEEEEEKEESAEDDMQLAWEILDLARVIYSDMDASLPETQKKLGEIHYYLGDISLEIENWDQAVSDFEKSIGFKTAVLEENSRELSEVYYKLALAYEYANKLEESHAQLVKSIDVLKRKIESLNTSITVEGKGKEPQTSDAAEVEQEIKELETILPDIESKVILFI